MAKSNIEWTEETWNPIVGCSILSPGCTNCYAMKMAARIEAMNASARPGHHTAPHYNGTTKQVNGHAVWTGKLALAESTLLHPLKRKKLTTYFVNSMGDLFHEDCPDEWIDKVFDVMESGNCDWIGNDWVKKPWHTFQILTKRAERMRNYMIARYAKKQQYADQFKQCPTPEMRDSPAARWARAQAQPDFWNNIWLGVSVERQQEADERIPELLRTPAAVRFISAEPLLGEIDLTSIAWGADHVRFPESDDILEAFSALHLIGGKKLDWVIVGGESGPDSRPMHPDWARSLRDQCSQANVPFFFKQWGRWSPTHPEYPNVVPHAVANDGTVYFSPDLAYPDGARYGQALRAGHDKSHLTSMYPIGKSRAGKLLDGVVHQALPARPAP